MRQSVPDASPSVDPAALGFSPEALRRAVALAKFHGSECLLVMRGGQVAASLGDATLKANIRSIRKSTLAALMGIAVEQGRISLGATLEQLGIDDRDGLSSSEKIATVYDLLTARSGIMHPAGYENSSMKALKPPRHAHAPGTRWTYNNWDLNALGTIYERAVRRSIPEAFATLLAAPLGMEDFSPEDASHVFSEESEHPAYPIRLSARDLARFGQLWLMDGSWAGRRIVPAHWVRCSVQPISDTGQEGAYGYMWWVCRQGMHFPGAILPYDSFSARGWGGHVLLVVPSLDLVVVHRPQTEVQPFRIVSRFALGSILTAVTGSIVA